MTPVETTALLTDQYELTMLAAALRSGAGATPSVFEVFARRLPDGRRYGIVAGTERVLRAVEAFTFDDAAIEHLRASTDLADDALEHLAAYRFTGDVDGYREGEVYLPGSPVLTVRGSFADAVLLETVVLSILNHDTAVASAAARMASAAGHRTLVEMGSRRTHEQAAVAAARAAYLGGFSATSNLAAGQRWGVPTAGTSAHSFTLAHATEEEAFAAQVAALGAGTTLLVDTYDISRGIERAVAAAGPGLGAVRIDSGDLSVWAHQARAQLDALGNTATRIVISGDLDEYALAALATAPVDSYGVGTSVVTGSGFPTADFVYKLVESGGRPVAKRSDSKASHGGAKVAVRRHRPSGTATEEVVSAAGTPDARDGDRSLQVPYLRGGRRVGEPVSLESVREHVREVMVTLPWEGLALSKGDPAIPTTQVPPG